MGISGAVFAFSSVIGPFVGGIFTDKLEYIYIYIIYYKFLLILIYNILK